MKTSFGILNNNISEISDWHQLINLESKFKDVKCAVTTISDDICSGTSITIYNKISNLNYVTFFVLGTDSSSVFVSNLILSPEEAVNIINSFGFSVSYIEKFKIDDETLKVLKSFLDLGFNFIQKINNDSIFVTKEARRRLEITKYLDVRESPNYENCDFSFLEPNIIHSIENLISEAQ